MRPGRLAVLALGALLAGAAGCGSDGEEAAERPQPKPELTVPGDQPPRVDRTGRNEEETDTEEAAPAQEGAPTGGAPAPQAAAPDGPDNDTPPPPGSAAERFENCAANPAACQSGGAAAP